MNDEKDRVRVRVHGRVQGVFYRQSTKETARALGLRGWVRNEDDGTVLLEAFGPKAGLDALIAWCRQGPGHAKVTDVDVEWLDPDLCPSGFDIR